MTSRFWTRQKIKSVYPLPVEISSLDKNSEFLPETFPVLIAIFNEKNVEQKMDSIGLAIIQAARSQVLIGPLQIGLAVQIHENCFPKILNDFVEQSRGLFFL